MMVFIYVSVNRNDQDKISCRSGLLILVSKVVLFDFGPFFYPKKEGRTNTAGSAMVPRVHANTGRSKMLPSLFFFFFGGGES